MNKQDCLREIEKYSSTAYVSYCVERVKSGTMSIDHALHEISSNTAQAYIADLTKKAMA